MAILQALLFGQTSPREQTLLSAVVAAAAAWPLLLVGTVFPKIALLVIAFVPLAKSVPSLWLRIVWMPEPKWKKLLRGFPITLALAAAFLMMLVVAPILRLVTVLKRREVVRMPALMDRSKTAETMALLSEVLATRGSIAPCAAMSRCSKNPPSKPRRTQWQRRRTGPRCRARAT